MLRRSEWRNILTPGEEVRSSWTFRKMTVVATDRRLILSGEFIEEMTSLPWRGYPSPWEGSFCPIRRKIFKVIDVAYEHILSIEYITSKELSVPGLTIGLLLVIMLLIAGFIVQPLIAFITLPFSILLLVKYTLKNVEYAVIHTAFGNLWFEVTGQKTYLDDLFIYIREREWIIL